MGRKTFYPVEFICTSQLVVRSHDPQTGRYFESDPIGLLGGINIYAYVEDNPVMYYDADGQL